MSLTKATYSMIQGASANVLDFGAVGDGVTDDTVAINLAINSGNSSVFFPNGTYLVNTTTGSTGSGAYYALGVLNKSNMTLYGDAVIKCTQMTGNVPAALQVYSCTNVNVIGLTFEGSGGDGLPGNGEVELRGSCVGCRIENCTVINARRNAITVEYPAVNNIVANNYVKNSLRHSIYISNANRTNVYGNVITETTPSGWSRIPIRCGTLQDASIIGVGNNIHDNTFDGGTYAIEIVGGGYAANLSIANNVISNTAGTSIVQITGTGAYGTKIQNNIIKNSAASAIFGYYTNDWCITGNIIDGAFGDGIDIRGGQNAVISGNVLTNIGGSSPGNNVGITLNAFSGTNSVNNIITSNTVTEGTGNIVYGITDYGLYGQIANNVISGASTSIVCDVTTFCDARSDNYQTTANLNGSNGTFGPYDGSVFFVTPGGAVNYNPSGTFRAGAVVSIANVGAHTLTFDSTGLNQAITAGQRASFAYNGSSWIKLYVA